MIKKGDVVDLIIKDMGYKGQSIGEIMDSTDSKFTVFADKGLVGDEISCEITKVKKGYALGRFLKFKRFSNDRIENSCIYNEACGGCSLIEMDYRAQLNLKEKHVLNALMRIGGLREPEVNPIVPMKENRHYRNKATMPISTGGNRMEKGGRLINLDEPTIGFYERGSHKVVNCLSCEIQEPAVWAAVEATRRFMREDNISAYDSRYGLGLMKYMTVRLSKSTGELMVTYIINGKAIPNAAKLISLLDEGVYKKGYFLESVNININKGKSRDVYGSKTRCIAGKPVILDKLGHLSLEVSPKSFYQVNPEQTEKLYNKVAEYAVFTGKETILDLYCGVGSIGLFCAKSALNPKGAAFVLGIESEKAAVVDANRNAVINHITEARFLCGRAEEVLPTLLSGEGDERLTSAAREADVVILDPPRRGCDPQLLKAVTNLAPDRIIYVSCDPATLARDLKILQASGYEFKEATPVDMFGHSLHVECIALIQRVKS